MVKNTQLANRFLETETWREETLSSLSPVSPPVTYEDIIKTTGKDNIMKELSSTIDTGFTEMKPEPYWRVRETLRIDGGVIFMSDRITVPEQLRAQVLNILHSPPPP